ncbi:response regulator transcription factor [Polaromonas sp. P1-6]|nr:response regulator transcription factor [Polaromonas sp. P1-6]
MIDNKIRVLLVDDHSIVRNGVQRMLETVNDIDVTGEAETAHDAMRLVRERDFDVALIDIALPDKSGLQLLKLIRAEKPKLAVLMLSMHSIEAYALRAIKLGAAGYLTKDIPATTLVVAVQQRPQAASTSVLSWQKNLSTLSAGATRRPMKPYPTGNLKS